MESALPILLTLVIGIAIGVLIGYLVFGRARAPAGAGGDKGSHKALQRLYSESPGFFSAVKDDLARPEFANVREFAIVPSSDITFVSEELRFVYYEDEVPNLSGLARELQSNGFIEDVTSGRTPIFRMREHFVEVLDSL